MFFFKTKDSLFFGLKKQEKKKVILIYTINPE